MPWKLTSKYEITRMKMDDSLKMKFKLTTSAYAYNFIF